VNHATTFAMDAGESMTALRVNCFIALTQQEAVRGAIAFFKSLLWREWD